MSVIIFHEGETYMREVDVDYPITDNDIEAIHIFNPNIDIMSLSKFIGLKIGNIVTPYPKLTYDIIQTHGLIVESITVICINIDGFVSANSIQFHKIFVDVRQKIPGLGPEHFTNNDIVYRINTRIDAVQENAKNLICIGNFSWDGINISEFNSLEFIPANTLVEEFYCLLKKVKINTLKMSVFNDDIRLVKILGRSNIKNIILEGFYCIYDIGLSNLNIDPILENHNVESLEIKHRDVCYTKLSSNLTIKKLVIRGSKCDQELISRVCNRNQARYSHTKSAKK